MFLAIAVDNLANAQILTEDEENEKRERELNRARNKQRYTHKGKGWGKAGAKLPVVMAFNHFVRKRNGHASPSVGDPPNTTWLVNLLYAPHFIEFHKASYFKFVAQFGIQNLFIWSFYQRLWSMGPLVKENEGLKYELVAYVEIALFMRIKNLSVQKKMKHS